MRAAILILMTTALAAGAATLAVPGDYGTVQAAIDAALPGDRIEIAPGDYPETLVLKGGLEILGMGQEPGEVRILGEGARPLGLLENQPQLTRLENLLFHRGWAEHGGGLSVLNSRLEMESVRFEGCGSMLEGGAVYSVNSDLRLERCIFLSCYSLGAEGAALYLQGEGPVERIPLLRNNTFFGTSLCCGNASIGMLRVSPVLENNILEELWCGPGADPLLTCNLGDFCGQNGGGHMIADPQFCDWGAGDLHVKPWSPCLPENNAGCGLIGALGVCEDQAAAETLSFGELKRLYR